MYLPKNDGGNFELTPAGTFIGRCYRFIDLGSHEQKFQGESKGLKRLVMIGYEINESMEDGRPFTIHKRYTWSMHEKSAMRKDLESWRGLKFTEADLGPGGFNTRDLLGKSCTLTVVHSENGENTFANIASIGKAMKGVPVPEPVNPPVYFSLERDLYEGTVLDSFSDKLKEFIRDTPEYRALSKPAPRIEQRRSEPEIDPARDPRYETGDMGFSENNPPPRDRIDDDGFPGDWPADKGGNRTHGVMAG